MDTRVALVTGASSGIGRACAMELAARGVRVYGTSRRACDEGLSPFPMLEMEMSADESVQQAIDTIVRREGRIDIVVNNAGMALAGPVEFTSMEEAARQMDVNLLGVFRVCRAVLPWMRRQGSGYILNMGSIGGLIAIPYQALYSASKFALEGLTESLRLEARPFGIQVVIIEPGDTRTEITRNRRLAKGARDQQIYGSMGRALERTAEDEGKGPGPEVVSRLVWEIVNRPNPRLRYTSGPTIQRAAAWIKRIVPYAWMEYGMRRYYGLD